MSHDQVSDMRLDGSEAKSGSGTSPSNGGGSQDSIDSLDEILKYHWPWIAYPGVVINEQGLMNGGPAKELVDDIAAWHNTQLKEHKAAVANEARKDEQSHKLDFYYLPNKSKDFHAGFNEAIDQLVKYRELRIAELSAKEEE